MNPSQIIQAVYDFTKSILRILRQQHRVVLDALFLTVAIVVCWMLWTGSSSDLVVYVGQRDSSSARAGKSIAAELRRTASPSGVPYRVRLVNTNGFEDIRQSVENSVDGIAIGFLSEIENKQGDTEDKRGPLSALLPLDWDYLHVMCRVEFLRSIESRTGKVPQDLSEVLGYLGNTKHRVFFGPLGSNSAKLGEIILSQYNLNTADHSATTLADWAGMRQAFKESQIDLAFYCGPVGSKTIMTMAGDETVALIGVGPIAEALALQQNMVVVPARLPENLARADVIPPLAAGAIHGTDTGEARSLPIPFCSKELNTVSVRRFLVCSSSLPTADAYLIAQAAKKSLEGDYLIDLKQDRPPYVRNAPTPPSHMPLHPGTERLRDQKPLIFWSDPQTWPSWFQLVLCGLALTMGIELLRQGQRKLDELAGLALPVSNTAQSCPAPVVSTSDQNYLRLKGRLETCEAELEQQTYIESDAKLGEWTERIRQLRKEIRDDRELSGDQREKLRAGVLSLRMDLMSLQREPTQPSKRGRGKATAPAASNNSVADDAN